MILGAGGIECPAGEELGSQIVKMRKQQQELVREKKRLTAELRNAQRRKVRLCTRTRMLTDMDLLEIMRMRAANARDAKDDQHQPGKAMPAGDAAGDAGSMPAGDAAFDASSKASEGNAEEL